VRLERIPWSRPEAPVESSLRDALVRDGFDVFRWEDPPNARYAAHSHDHDESLWVLAGEIRFGADGADLRLRAGDRLMLPAGTVHTARTGDAGATYLIGQRRADRPGREAGGAHGGGRALDSFK
jgi:quercetin dioxygenase-like cupin family protein